MPIKVCTTLESGAEVCTTIDVGDDAAHRAYTTTIGDGVTLSYTLAHNLDALELVPVIRDTSTGALTAAAAVTVIDEDRARLDFTTAPTTGQLKVTLLAVTPAA
jgi:hypothetical protein